MTTLIDMQERVFECNEANGWFDDERTFDDDVALLHSEVSEMFEAYRDYGYEDATVTERYVGIDALTKTDPVPVENPKPEGFGSEAADVLVRILDTHHRRNLRLGWDTIEDIRTPHGYFTPASSVGTHIDNLHMLITLFRQAQGKTSLGGLLSYLKTWCDSLGVDLEAEFERKLAFNATRGHKHGGKRL